MALLDFRERLFFGPREVDENLSVKPKNTRHLPEIWRPRRIR